MLQLQRRTLKRFSSLADLKKHQQTKDFSDQDKFLTMQRKWRQYSEQMKNEKPRMWNGNLNKTQQLKIDLLVSNVSSLGASQYRLFEHLLKEQATKRYDYDGITYSMTPEELSQSESTIFPTSNPKWQLQQEALAKLWPLGQQGLANALSKVGGSGGATTSTSPKVATQAVVEPEKAKVEKSNFDVQLASFDPTNKIKIIKEVREILKLGLKEAKDLVESAPCTIQKAASKDDAEKLKEKLEALKCQINLL